LEKYDGKSKEQNAGKVCEDLDGEELKLGIFCMAKI